MSKLLNITPEHISDILNEFRELLESGKFSDGKISYIKTLTQTDRKADLYFTETAWQKMQALIREFDKEVAWHGIATRGSDLTKDEYIITDILVYPQEVSAATVTTDQNKYTEWLYSFDDDVFFNIRMQGHSHVNMSTSPSSVDLQLYDGILQQMGEDSFYIFAIFNKKGERTIKIYDMLKNMLFETSDVTVSVIEDENGIERFLREAKEMVQDKTSASKISVGNVFKDSDSSNKKSEDDKKTETKSKKGKRVDTYDDSIEKSIYGRFSSNLYGYNDPYYYGGY